MRRREVEILWRRLTPRRGSVYGFPFTRKTDWFCHVSHVLSTWVRVVRGGCLAFVMCTERTWRMLVKVGLGGSMTALGRESSSLNLWHLSHGWKLDSADIWCLLKWVGISWISLQWIGLRISVLIQQKSSLITTLIFVFSWKKTLVLGPKTLGNTLETLN